MSVGNKETTSLDLANNFFYKLHNDTIQGGLKVEI